MQSKYAPTSLLVSLAAAALALSFFILPASAAPVSAPQLDAEVAQRLQTTPSSGLIPVIVEGAGLAAPTTNTTRAQTAEARILSYGGHVLGSSSLLGASVAELTPDQVRSLASDPSIGSIHLDADVRATALATDDSTSGATPITFQQTIGANQVWGSGDAGQGVAVAVLDTGIADNPDAFGDRVKARVDLVNPAQPVAGDPIPRDRLPSNLGDGETVACGCRFWRLQ